MVEKLEKLSFGKLEEQDLKLILGWLDGSVDHRKDIKSHQTSPHVEETSEIFSRIQPNMRMPTVKAVSIITEQQRIEVLSYLIFLKDHYERTCQFELRIKVNKIIFQYFVMKQRILEVQKAVKTQTIRQSFKNFN